jgi:hypothetical protein
MNTRSISIITFLNDSYFPLTKKVIPSQRSPLICR